jgi:hypothetical protein
MGLAQPRRYIPRNRGVSAAHRGRVELPGATDHFVEPARSGAISRKPEALHAEQSAFTQPIRAAADDPAFGCSHHLVPTVEDSAT